MLGIAEFAVVYVLRFAPSKSASPPPFVAKYVLPSAASAMPLTQELPSPFAEVYVIQYLSCTRVAPRVVPIHTAPSDANAMLVM